MGPSNSSPSLPTSMNSSEQEPNNAEGGKLHETEPTLPRYTFVPKMWTPPPASFWTTPSKDSMEGQQTAAAIAAEARSKLMNKVDQLHNGVLYWPPARDELNRPRSPTKELIS